MDDAVARALLEEARRRMFGESQPRILRCLEQLSDEQVWWRPNPASNSVGNLVLHLCGNVGQWVVAGLGDSPDDRNRQAEFDERGPIPRRQLIDRFNATMAAARSTLERFDPAAMLTERPVQCYRETPLSIVVHVVEHLSYHTGQIAYVTKMLSAQDLGFYAGQNLGARGGSE